MKIDIHARQIRLGRDLKEQIVRRLDFALSRFAPRLASARLVLSDQNGPKGGRDQHGRLEIVGRGGWSLHLEEIGDALPAVIDRLADRAGRVVGRTVRRLNDRSQARVALRAGGPAGGDLS